jgi:hypothetical protein
VLTDDMVKKSKKLLFIENGYRPNYNTIGAIHVIRDRRDQEIKLQKIKRDHEYKLQKILSVFKNEIPMSVEYVKRTSEESEAESYLGIGINWKVKVYEG